jgi:hypothetical protein
LLTEQQIIIFTVYLNPEPNLEPNQEPDPTLTSDPDPVKQIISKWIPNQLHNPVQNSC